jgi:predicted P-loop ATPase
MAKRQRPTLDLTADQVWAAACAAYRVNGGYFKQPEVTDQGVITRPTNRELVRQYLAEPSSVTADDLEQGRKCRQDLLKQATMSALKNRATEWDLLTAEMAGLDTITTDYQLSVITAMPKSHSQNLARETVDSRLAYCDSDPVGRIDERVEITGQVVRSNYSNQYNTHYVTVITDTNRQAFFAYRERIEPGANIKICGRVKRHADRATQLSRVKIHKQEAV